ncbi:MAG: lysophospholipid acyltransferase family protein [Pseudomonadota bacterium]
MLRATADAGFGLWFVLVFTILTLLCVMCIAILPGLHRRQRVVAKFARGVFLFTGSSPACTGMDILPDGPVIVVANHASYLDGILMTAVLPPRFSFVIKSEMSRVPLAGFLLRRIDSFFVDRGTKSARSTGQARQIITAARDGRALGFFPEGTFRHEAGLLKFYNGAFSAALAGNMPIVPCAITGTRAMLAADHRLPRWGRLSVTLLPLIEVDKRDPDQTVAVLRDQARNAILAHCGEHDASDVTLPKPGSPAPSSA